MSFTIDVHHHILPDVFSRATNDTHSPVGGILPSPWSKQSTLTWMTRDRRCDKLHQHAGRPYGR